MNAILDRLLAGAVSEPQWVTLVLITGSGGTADRDEFTSRVAHALKADRHTGDLPQPDLDVAARVLSTVLERAEADLACRS